MRLIILCLILVSCSRSTDTAPCYKCDIFPNVAPDYSKDTCGNVDDFKFYENGQQIPHVCTRKS